MAGEGGEERLAPSLYLYRLPDVEKVGAAWQCVCQILSNLCIVKVLEKFWGGGGATALIEGLREAERRFDLDHPMWRRGEESS